VALERFRDVCDLVPALLVDGRFDLDVQAGTELVDPGLRERTEVLQSAALLRSVQSDVRGRAPRRRSRADSAALDHLTLAVHGERQASASVRLVDGRGEILIHDMSKMPKDTGRAGV